MNTDLTFAANNNNNPDIILYEEASQIFEGLNPPDQ
jgi:hypothetical protein